MADRIPISGVLGPIYLTDTYPVTDPIYGIDGLRNVDTLSEMYDIPIERRRSGMLVGVSGGSTYYKLKPSPWTLGSASNWEAFSSGGMGTINTIPKFGTNSNLVDSIITTSGSNVFINGFTALSQDDITTSGGTIDPLTETKLVSSSRHYHKYNDIVSSTGSYSGVILNFTNEFQIINPTFGQSITISSISGISPGKQTFLKINSIELSLSKSYNYIGNLIVCGTAINGVSTINGFTMTNTVANLLSSGFASGSVVFVGSQSFIVANTFSTTQLRLTTTNSISTPSVPILASSIDSSILLDDILRIGNFLVRVTGFSSSGGITHSVIVDSSNLTYYNQVLYRSNLLTITVSGVTISQFGYFLPGTTNRLMFQCEDSNSVNVYYTTKNI
jgi:hypothetical protein